MHRNFLTHSSADRHLGCFHVLAVAISAATNIGVQVSFSVLVSSGYVPSSGIARLHGGLIPGFPRNLHSVLHRGCISLHSHQQCKRVPSSPPPRRSYLLFLLVRTEGTGACPSSGPGQPLRPQGSGESPLAGTPGGPTSSLGS